jgi:hypothetical protein
MSGSGSEAGHGPRIVVTVQRDAVTQGQHGQARLHLGPGRLPADLQRQPAPHRVDDLVHGHAVGGLGAFARIAVVPGERILDPPAQFGPIHDPSLLLLPIVILLGFGCLAHG